MSTPGLTIERLTATVHTSTGGGPVGRAESLLHRTAQTRLPSDLDDFALLRGHLCIERLDVPLTLLADDADDQVVHLWSGTLAAAINHAVRQRAPGTAWFAHDLAALVDALTGIVTHRLTTRWAWLQMGICTPADPAPVADPAGAFLAALGRSGPLATPALIQTIASTGVAPLDRTLGESGWRAVEVVLGLPASHNDVGLVTELANDDQRAARIYARSAIAELTRRSRLRLSRAAAAGLAALAVAEVEPALVDDPRSVTVRHQLANLLAAMESAPRSAGPTNPGRDQPGANRSRQESVDSGIPAAENPAGASRRDSPAGTMPPATLPPDPSPPSEAPTLGQPEALPYPASRNRALVDSAAPAEANPRPSAVPDPHTEIDDLPPDGGHAHGTRNDGSQFGGDPHSARSLPTAAQLPPEVSRSASDPASVQPPLPASIRERAPLQPAANRRGKVLAEYTASGPADQGPDRTPSSGLATRWAGLPFLLALRSELGLPERIRENPVLGRRPLSWVQQQVAGRLVEAEPADPAVLAFAGLAVSGRPDPPPNPAEASAITELASEWAQALRRRLLTTDPTDGDDPSPSEAVLQVARRDGAVLAERGWIEIVLPADQVDMAVRRAGLDLDPGWIWWLGVVLRYRYV